MILIRLTSQQKSRERSEIVLSYRDTYSKVTTQLKASRACAIVPIGPCKKEPLGVSAIWTDWQYLNEAFSIPDKESH